MECDYSSSRQDNLNKHIKKRHSYTSSVHNIPPKIALHEPIPNIEPPANYHLLEQLEYEEIQSMLEQNNQVGFGVTQMNSTDATLPDEIRQFLEMSNLGAQTEIFGKFMSKIFLEFATLKPLTDVPEFTLDIYAMIVLLLLKPLPMPLKISFVDKPTHSRSICHFHSFYNPEKLVNSVIITSATTTKY